MSILNFDLNKLATIFTDLNESGNLTTQPMLKHCFTFEGEKDLIPFYARMIDSVLEWVGFFVSEVEIDEEVVKGEKSRYSKVVLTYMKGIHGDYTRRQINDAIQLMVDDAHAVFGNNHDLIHAVIKQHDDVCGSSRKSRGDDILEMLQSGLSNALGNAVKVSAVTGGSMSEILNQIKDDIEKDNDGFITEPKQKLS